MFVCIGSTYKNLTLQLKYTNHTAIIYMRKSLSCNHHTLYAGGYVFFFFFFGGGGGGPGGGGGAIVCSAYMIGIVLSSRHPEAHAAIGWY